MKGIHTKSAMYVCVVHVSEREVERVKVNERDSKKKRGSKDNKYLVGAPGSKLRDKLLQLGNEIGDLRIRDLSRSTGLSGTRSSGGHCELME